MKHRPVLVALLLAARTLAAQPSDIPVDLPLCLPGAAVTDFHHCTDPSVTALKNGRFVVVADFASPFESLIVAEILDAYGRVAGRPLARASQTPEGALLRPVVAAGGSGGFVAAWEAFHSSGIEIHLQWYDSSAHPRRPAPVVVADRQEPACNWMPSLAANEAGQAVIGWEQTVACTSESPPFGLELQAFNAHGKPATPRLHVAPTDPSHGLGRPRIGIDAVGRFTAVWVEKPTSADQFLRGQRFRRKGQPLGEPFEIHGTGWVHDHRVLPDGRVAVVWGNQNPPGLFELGLYELDGTPVAPRLDLGAGPGGGTGGIAADRHGNLAIFGRSDNGRWLRLVNRDLVPQGGPGPLEFPAAQNLSLPRGTGVALSDQGLALTVMTTASGSGFTYLIGHLVRARHEDDTCVRTVDGAFLCDTAGDGGEAEARVQWNTGPPWGTPYLADWNGDGRDDPCVSRARIFSCDLDHDGAPDVESPRIGKPGDLPLLADLDGDGRADPCVRRGAALLCDRARDGGATDLQILFGNPGERLLLGDPDGDGRDDPCVEREGVLRCDTRHDGGAAELELDLNPLQARGKPLFGDIDGDGRDDVCLFQGTRFLCAVFPAQGGSPRTTWEIPFGQPGGIPLLGDLDAF